MEKCEFSETQFVLGYARELFNSIPNVFRIYAPSTRKEKEWAADLILRKYSKKNKYKISVYYQFKRSKYYNKKIFYSLKGGITIDTSIRPKYAFNIYNASGSKQFNHLQRLAREPRNKVFYCAPVFHTLRDFNVFFSQKNIMTNSITIDMAQQEIQKLRVPLNSSPTVLFDKVDKFICSDPIKIEGNFIDVNQLLEISRQFDSINFTEGIDSEISAIREIALKEESISYLPERSNNIYFDFIEHREWLLRALNIFWFPILER